MRIAHAGREKARRNGIEWRGAMISDALCAMVKATAIAQAAAGRREPRGPAANAQPHAASGTSEASTGTVMLSPVPSLKLVRKVTIIATASARLTRSEE